MTDEVCITIGSLTVYEVCFVLSRSEAVLLRASRMVPSWGVGAMVYRGGRSGG